MARSDWLVGGDRRTAAAERIYAAATDVIARDGYEAFDIDALAARVHCSRATIYRHAGGKAEIRDAVMVRSAARIVDAVRTAVDGLSGSQRIVTAITVALEEIRSDPLGQLMFGAIRGGEERAWLTESPIVARFATELNGLDRRRHRGRAVDRPRRAVIAVLADRGCGRRASDAEALHLSGIRHPNRIRTRPWPPTSRRAVQSTESSCGRTAHARW